MRRRLVFAITLVAVGTLALFAIPLSLSVRDNFRSEEFLRLQRDAVAATRQIDLDVSATGTDPVELPEGFDAVGVYDALGRLIAGRGPREADATVLETLRSGRPGEDRGGGDLVASAPLVVNERLTGALRATRSEEAVTSRTRRSWLRLAGFALAAIAAAVVAALAVGRWLARPLERIAVAARRLGEGDFAARASPSGVAEVDAVGEVLGSTASRLEAVLTRERAFSADASHQLRTPLAALRIELEAIELRGGAPPELAPALAQVDRLQTTIDTLLAVARDAPRGGHEAQVSALIGRLEGRWRPLLATVGRRLRVVIPTPEPVAAISPDVAVEILSVLLENALRHGAGTVTLSVRRTRPGLLAIDVADEGQGVSGSLDDVFRRRAGGSAAGHGIGLALARSLADAEGASLVLASTRQTMFTLTTPEIARDRATPA